MWARLKRWKGDDDGRAGGMVLGVSGRAMVARSDQLKGGIGMSSAPQQSWDDDDLYNDHAGYPEDDCDHEDYEADILDGTAKCWRCGYRWTQTASEIEREIEAQAAWDQQCEEWERERRSPLNRLRNLAMRVRVWWQRPRPRATDDEIPF